MNIAQATTSGTRIGRGAGAEVAGRLFQPSSDNGYLLGVIYALFSGTAIMHRIALLSGLLALTSCTSTPTVVENSAAAVTVRYDGIVNKIDDATQVAQKACAAHDKMARLRKVNDEGIGQHFGHFDCISLTGLP
jgi:hypothetical protein